MRQSWWHAAAVTGLVAATLTSGEAYTPKHEEGRCALRGTCGKSSIFSPELPCVDNGLAEEPADDVRKQLVEICGPKWDSGPVCCAAEQVWRPSFAFAFVS
jgi:Niemann-Pick C1 protein